MIKSRKSSRETVKNRIRAKIYGTETRPRMSVFRSLDHIYVQFVDDDKGVTIASMSTLSKEVEEDIKETNTKVEKSFVIGKKAAEILLSKNVTEVVFDRNGFRYHGRIKAVADGAREAGLKF